MNRHVAIHELSLERSLREALEQRSLAKFLSCITAENADAILDAKGVRPLHMACCLPSTVAISKLLDLGADVNAAGDMGTALHTAVELGNFTAFPLLIGSPAFNPNTLDRENRSALRLACESMAQNRPGAVMVLDYLLWCGLPEISLGEGLNVAFFAYLNGSVEALELLKNRDLKGQVGHIPIGDILRFRHLGLLQRYREEVGDTACFERISKYRNEDGATALHELCLSDSYIPLIEVLGTLSQTALPDSAHSFVDAEDHNGYRPIHYAASKNAVGTVQLLIKLGADDRVSDRVASPIDMAIDTGSYDSFLLLRGTISPQILLQRCELSWKNAQAQMLALLSNPSPKIQPELEKRAGCNMPLILCALKKFGISFEPGSPADAIYKTLQGLQKIQRNLELLVTPGVERGA